MAVPNLDLRRITMPPQIGFDWRPGVTAQPVAGALKLNDHQALVMGVGGRTRLEQTAAEFLAAHISRDGLNDGAVDALYADIVEEAFDLAEKFLEVSDRRMYEAAQKMKAAKDAPAEEPNQAETVVH